MYTYQCQQHKTFTRTTVTTQTFTRNTLTTQNIYNYDSRNTKLIRVSLSAIQNMYT